MMPLLFSLIVSQPGPRSPAVVEWRTRPDDPTRVYLYVDGRQRGGYDWELDQWRDYDGEGWGPPRSFRTHGSNRGSTNFGVMRERLANKERCTIRGQTLARSGGIDTATLFPDDSDWLRLTIIGEDAERQAVLSDLTRDPDLSEAARGMLVQAYAPDDWAVADSGFVTSGSPTIYLQSADGRVLHRQDEYHGPKRLAAALRRARPDYDPAQDPNLDRPASNTQPFFASRRLWFALSLLALLTLFRRNPR